MADPMDNLLDEALRTGQVPPHGDAAARAELEAALRAATLLRAARSEAERETAPARAAARARFERYVAAQRPLSTPARPEPRLRRRWRLQGNAALALAGLAAVFALVVLAALILPRRGDGGGVQTALALAPGDYAEVQGIVREVKSDGSSTLLLDSSVGPLQVSLADGYLAPGGPAAQPGASVVVAGVVGGDGATIAASSLAGSTAEGRPALPIARTTLLRTFREGISGTIVTFAVGADGQRVRAVLRTGEGDQLLVPLGNAAALRALEEGLGVGATVRVSRPPAGETGFVLEPVGAAGARSATAIMGVVSASEGNQLVLATPRGEVRVLVTAATRVILGESGLTRQQVRQGDLVGRRVVATAAPRPRGQLLVAQVLAVGALSQP